MALKRPCSTGGISFQKKNLDVIDELILWHRKVSRLVANIRMRETELTFTFGAAIPRMPVVYNGETYINKPQLSYDQFKSQLENGRLRLTPNPWLSNFSNVRVLGANLSYAVSPDTDMKDPKILREFQFFRLRALLIPPEQRPKGQASELGADPIQRKAILFDDVELDTGAGSREKFESGVSLHNIDPRGDWEIDVGGWFHSYSDESAKLII